MANRFRPNPKVEEQLEKQPTARQLKRRMADEIRDKAEALAPRGKSRRGVAKTFRVVDGRHKGGEAGEVRVETNDPFGHLVEFGSVNNPAYAPLRRAVVAAGYRLKKNPKT